MLTVALVGVTCISAVAWNPIGLGQFHATKLLVLGVSGLLALWVSLRRRQVLVPGPWPVFVALGAWIVVAAVLNPDRAATFLGYSDRHAGVLMWCLFGAALIAGVNADADQRRLVMRAVAVTAGVVAGMAVFQRAGLGPFQDIEFTGGRPGASFGSAAFTGAYLAIGFALAVGWLTELDDRNRRMIIGALPIVIAVGIALTASRAAWLGTAAASAVMLWYSPNRRVVAIAISAAAAVGTTAALVVGNGADRAVAAFSSTEGTGAGRRSLWSAVWPTVRDRPLRGWGPDRTRAGFPLNLPADFESRFGTDTIPDRAHNVVADIAIWIGVPGALLWIAVAVVLLRTGHRQIRDGRYEAVALTAALTAHLGHLMFNFVTIELDVTTAVLAGFVLSNEAQELNMTESPRRIITPTIAVVGAMFVVWSGALVAADIAARRAVDHERAQNVAAARASWTRATVLTPTESKPLEALSRFELRAGNGPAAIAAADEAVGRNPDPYNEELAAAMRVDAVARGLIDPNEVLLEGIQRYEALTDKWPTHASAFVGYAVGLAIDGQTDEAVIQFERAVQIDTSNALAHYNLALIHRNRGDVTRALEVVNRGLAESPDDADLSSLRVELTQ